MFSVVALVVLTAGYFYARSFGTDGEKLTLIIFVAVYGAMTIYLYSARKIPAKAVQYMIVVAILAVSFAAMIYELQDTANISVFVPICFILTGLVFLLPMHRIIGVDVLLLVIFVVLSVNLERNA